MANDESPRVEILGEEILSTMEMPELVEYMEKLKTEIRTIRRETAIMVAETAWFRGELPIPSKAMH